MNRLTLWLANAALIAAACAATAWVLGQRPASATDPKGDSSKGARSERKADRKGSLRDTESAAGPGALSTPADVDVLWQQTLFRPERTEDPTQPVAEDPAAAAAALNLELVGLARIGDRAVAIIVQHRGQVPRRGATGAAGARPGVPRRPAVPAVPALPAVPGEPEAEEPEGPPDRHVYKVGDAVGDSGYTLKEIRLQEKEVVLTRGSEERVLKLETADDQSSSRRETAAAQEAAAKPPPEPPAQPAGPPKPPGEAAVAGATAQPGAPPPPPPPPGGAATPPTLPGAPATAAGAAPAAEPVAGREVPNMAPMTREERLERARLLRERILQGRTPATPAP